MSKQEPMLMESPLTNRVFVVTSYVDNGDGTFTARQKHDVTEQFDALDEMRRGEGKVVASSTDGLTTNEPRQWFKLSCGRSFKLDGLDAPMACPICGKAVKR